MENLGEQLYKVVVIKKVLRILTSKWNQIVIIIEETKDMSTLKIDQLICSLMSHEERLKETTIGGNEGKVFTSKEANVNYSGQAKGNGQGRG